MKRLLLHLLAALSLPTAVNAESVWLILRSGRVDTMTTPSLEKVEMKDMAQCEFQGNVWMSSKRINPSKFVNYSGFECIEGK